MNTQPINDERRLDGRAGSGPVTESERITTFDLVRGIAVLGMLLMNAVAINMGTAAYLNLNAGGSETWLDWAIGVFGEIFVDQKFMGLFSLIFGAGVLMFVERMENRESHPIMISTWRNLLLLGIGLLHALLWNGDVLAMYAVCALILLFLRNLPVTALIGAGAVIFLLSVPTALLMQYIANTTDVPLAGIWEPGGMEGPQMLLSMWLEGSMKGGITLFLCSNMLELTLTGFFLRALGLILVGAGLYQLGFMHGRFSTRFYQLIAAGGLGIGLSLGALGVIFTAVGGFSREVAFIGQIPNILGTVPAALGLIALIVLWEKGEDSALKQRLRAVGQTALTNYLGQTVFGVLILNVALGSIELTRSWIFLFCMAMWAVHLLWSPLWLKRYRFGPVEWLWRTATYRKRQFLCRTATPPYLGRPAGVQ